MFASPGNTKLKNFVSRWPHYQATRVDALKCPLEDFHHIFANPPWTIIHQWLHRLRQYPHLKCLIICPLWVSAPWWPLLIKLHIPQTPVWEIQPAPGMFFNSMNQSMPMPRWPLVSILLSGQSWNSQRCTLKMSKITLDKICQLTGMTVHSGSFGES